jgi:hypothetical protein
MNSDQIQQPGTDANREAIQSHLAKFQQLKSQGHWKEAMHELNLSLDAILKTLENARLTLRRVNQKFAERNKGLIKRERVSPELVFVEYPGGKWSLVKDSSQE